MRRNLKRKAAETDYEDITHHGEKGAAIRGIDTTALCQAANRATLSFAPTFSRSATSRA